MRLSNLIAILQGFLANKGDLKVRVAGGDGETLVVTVVPRRDDRISPDPYILIIPGAEDQEDPG